jgi:arylsulfatase A-like enzyme
VPSFRPLGESLSTTVPAALAAGALVAVADVVQAGGPGIGAALGLALALYALPALGLGIGLGVLLAAWRVTFGEHALRRALARVRADRELDHRITAGLIAGAGAGGVYAFLAAILALRLVADVQRAGVGALLFGVAITAALPLAVAIAAPLYRAARPLARAVPRLGSIPACVVLSGATIAAVALVAVLLIRARLDWRAIDLGAPTIAVGLASTMGAWLAAWYGPLARVRRQVPRPPLLVGAAAAIALLLPVVALRGTPSTDALTLLTERTTGARLLVSAARGLRDADGDGYSAFLGGADCNDQDPAVHPGASEIPDNGTDDNCIGGDRSSADDDGPLAPPEPAPPTRAIDFRGNLLVVLIDTTRADALGVADLDRPSRTPNIDALAARGAYFTRAYAQAPNTARSVPSIMASRLPSQIAVDQRFKNFPRTLDDNVLLFELLASHGLETRGFASHYSFNVNPGIRQGFGSFDNRGATPMESSGNEIAAPQVIPRAIEALDELSAAKTRFAMFVHLFEPHSAYLTHPETPARGSSMRARYQGEVAFADRWLGVLLDALDARGLAGDTAVVLLSDHGEAFGEHRVAGRAVYYHGRTLYDEVLRVPLIIAVPGLEPQRIDTPVMLIDLAPTVLEILGASRPPSFLGRSLAGALLGEPLEPRPLFSELIPAPYWNHSAKAMITGDGAHKLILRLSPERRAELYDLAADPGEARDLARKDPERLEALTGPLVKLIETVGD